MHSRLHPCKRHSSNAVDAVYMYTKKNMGRDLLAPSVGRSPCDRRPTIGAVGRLSADDRPIKGHRPSIWRLSPDDRPTIGRLLPWLIHI